MAKDKPKRENIGAFFDVDGTVAASNLVAAYIDFRLFNRPLLKKTLWILGFAPKLPFYAVTDMISRSLFNRTFFRNYKGVCSDHLQAWVSSKGTKFWASRLFPFALNEIRKHQNQGNKVFLVTGGLRNMVQPLKELLSADACIAVEMTSNEGYLTGNLTGDPLTGSVKASAVRRLVDEWGLDVTRSYAYADSYADKAFLECVGHPVAVNPDRRLKRLAKQRGWDIKSWKMSVGVEQPKKCARLDSE